MVPFLHGPFLASQTGFFVPNVRADLIQQPRTWPMQLATMLGIAIDKFTGTRAAVEKLKAEAAKTKGADPMAVEDDPITKALKEELHGPQ